MPVTRLATLNFFFSDPEDEEDTLPSIKEAAPSPTPPWPSIGAGLSAAAVPAPASAISALAQSTAMGAGFGIASSAPTSYDIATVSEATISKLKSGSAADRATGQAIERAKINWGEYCKTGARLLITTSPGNGGYPVAVMIPAGFDRNKAAKVHTHYHGYACTITESVADSGRVQMRIRSLQKDDPQLIFILPECRNAPAGTEEETPSYISDWSNVSNQVQTTSDALKAARVNEDKVELRVLSAHSGGHGALDAIMFHHKDGSGIACDRLELLDCVYGMTGANLAAYAATENGKKVKQVRAMFATNERWRARPIAGAFGSRYKERDVQHSGTTKDEMALKEDGTPYVDRHNTPLHRFATMNEAGFHTRARGEFLHHVSLDKP